jgi:2-dehydropantoate 2-reductase
LDAEFNVKHAILGAGGVGGVIGAILARAGEDVTLVVRPGTAANYPGEVSLESHFGKATGVVQVAEALPQSTDVLWLTVKATQLESALAGIPQHASMKAVVPLLNGTEHVSVLRERFGHDRVIPATIAGEMERIAPGKYVHRSPFLRLNVALDGKAVLDGVIEKFKSFGLECKYIDNEQTLLWGKMVFLAPFALSTSAAAQPIGGVLSDPERHRRLDDCIRETVEAGRANGAELDAGATIKMMGGAPAQMRSSMQKDVEAGRPPELDAIAGPILRTAKAHGFHANATQQLVDEIKRRLKA